MARLLNIGQSVDLSEIGLSGKTFIVSNSNILSISGTVLTATNYGSSSVRIIDPITFNVLETFNIRVGDYEEFELDFPTTTQAPVTTQAPGGGDSVISPGIPGETPIPDQWPDTQGENPIVYDVVGSHLGGGRIRITWKSIDGGNNTYRISCLKADNSLMSAAVYTNTNGTEHVIEYNGEAYVGLLTPVVSDQVSKIPVFGAPFNYDYRVGTNPSTSIVEPPTGNTDPEPVPAGNVSTLAAPQIYDALNIASGSNGEIYATYGDGTLQNVNKISKDGTITRIANSTFLSKAIAVDGLDNVYIAYTLKISKVNPDKTYTTIAGWDSQQIYNGGPVDGIGLNARFKSVVDVKFGPDGYLYILESIPQTQNGSTVYDKWLRRLDPVTNEVITIKKWLLNSTIVGHGTSLAIADDGLIYISTTTAIYRVDKFGTVALYTGHATEKGDNLNGSISSARFNIIRHIYCYDNYLYILDSYTDPVLTYIKKEYMRRINLTTKIVSLVFGSDRSYQDGDTSIAKLYSPTFFCVADDGLIYLTDYNDQISHPRTRVRKVDIDLPERDRFYAIRGTKDSDSGLDAPIVPTNLQVVKDYENFWQGRHGITISFDYPNWENGMKFYIDIQGRESYDGSITDWTLGNLLGFIRGISIDKFAIDGDSFTISVTEMYNYKDMRLRVRAISPEGKWGPYTDWVYYNVNTLLNWT